MGTYLLVSVILVLLGLGYESVNSITKIKYNKRFPSYFYFLPSFLLLFIISAFRGDFTTDYKNYSILFHRYNQYDFSNVFKVGFLQEPGYLFLSRLIGTFTSNEVFLFVVTTFIILFLFYGQISKYSVNIWISVLMFSTVGAYYPSFNITRQILAVAIIFAGSKFLYERKFFKYVLMVILASSFHVTALIMIPFYFILNFRINLRNIFFILVGSSIVVYFFQDILYFSQSVGIYDNYTDKSYGMTGASFTNAALSIAFAIFTLFHIKKLDSKNNNMHRIWFNAILFYAFGNILSLQVQMVERLSHFFSPYAILLIPFIFSKMQDRRLRVIYSMVLIAALILYNFLVLYDSVFDPYYFIWDK